MAGRLARVSEKKSLCFSWKQRLSRQQRGEPAQTRRAGGTYSSGGLNTVFETFPRCILGIAFPSAPLADFRLERGHSVG